MHGDVWFIYQLQRVMHVSWIGTIWNTRPVYRLRISLSSCVCMYEQVGIKKEKKKIAGRKWACLGDVVGAGSEAVDARGQPQSDAPWLMPSSDGVTLRDVLRSVKVLIPAAVSIIQYTFSPQSSPSLTSTRQVTNQTKALTVPHRLSTTKTLAVRGVHALTGGKSCGTTRRKSSFIYSILYTI